MDFKNIEKLSENQTKENKFLERLEEKMSEIKDTYIYIKSVAKYYWVEAKTFFSPADV
jgi:hypothetical protein